MSSLLANDLKLLEISEDLGKKVIQLLQGLS